MMIYPILNIIFLIIIILLLAYIFLLNKNIKSITLYVENALHSDFRTVIKIETYNKRIIHLIGILNVVFEEIEQKYRENKKFQKDNKEMISNVSHDLRTPLTSLLGYLEMLKDTKKLEAQQQLYLNIACEKAILLNKRMEEFFQLAKLESNDMITEFKKFNISELLRERLIAFFNQFNKMKINPIVQLPKKDIYVMGDKGLIARAIDNLLSNELKYGYDNGIIGIKLMESNECVYIEIWDNGKGVDKLDIDKIFNRLYMSERSRNLSLHSSGLGLYIVKKLVEMHGGKIYLESIPDEKTVFTVKLPKNFQINKFL